MACKDYKKIPQERLYEMNKKLHVVSFVAESEEVVGAGKESEDGDGGDDDDLVDEEAEDLDDDP